MARFKRRYSYVKINAGQCAKCHAVIVSTHVHDFVECPCGAAFVDGGQEYSRRTMDTIPLELYARKAK